MDKQFDLDDFGKCLRIVECPQCHKKFGLAWNDYSYVNGTPQTLHIRACPSGGIYDVSITCPHCDYKEEL